MPSSPWWPNGPPKRAKRPALGRVESFQNHRGGQQRQVGRYPPLRLLVDVPARYETFSEAGAGRSPDMHYRTMTVEELIAMGPLVRALAAKGGAP